MGKSTKSPKLRHNMRLEAERMVVKRRKTTCTFSSIRELFK